jgi:anti-anti-sigma regulatory factor
MSGAVEADAKEKRMGSIEVKDTETGKEMRLSGTLGIEQASDLKSRLLETLRDCTELKLDLSLVESADLACIQVLCAAHRSSVKAGIKVSLASPVSQGLKTSMRDMALDPTACDPPHSRDCLWRKEDDHV